MDGKHVFPEKRKKKKLAESSTFSVHIFKTHKNAKKKLPLSFCMRFARSAKQVTTRKFTYPMSLPGFQEVFMPSLMPIGPKLWALDGFRQIDIRTEIL